MPNPDWTRDELILALDLYFLEPSARGSKSHPAVIKLSEVLNKLPIHALEQLDADFLNPNGVGMKLRTPDFKRGSRLEKDIWETMTASDSALAIRENTGRVLSEMSESSEMTDEAEEGRILSELGSATRFRE